MAAIETGRSRAKFVIEAHLLISLLQQSGVLEGLPEDARIVSAHNEWMMDGIGFVVESKEYPVTPMGEMLPSLGAFIHASGGKVERIGFHLRQESGDEKYR